MINIFSVSVKLKQGEKKMKRTLMVFLTAMVLLTACGGAGKQDTGSERDEIVTIYKSPTWGCCVGWRLYLENNGFTVNVVEKENLTGIKSRYQVPPELQTCHTAIVDGYVIEGHVPVAEIERLLSERPDIIGIGVAGMPPGSPGMDIEGFETDPYDVVAFDKKGVTGIFASYPKK